MGMVDVRQKGLSPRAQVEDSTKKSCVDCNTTKTPLWRGGPKGPKSLCNACGIKFRKKKISTNRGCDRKRERPHSTAATSSSETTAVTTTCGGGSGDGEGDLGECRSFRMRLMMPMPLEEEMVVVQNVPSSVKKQRCQRRRKLGEEEQAAASLMALSCGSVFA